MPYFCPSTTCKNMTKKKSKETEDETAQQPAQKSSIIEEAKKTMKRKKASMRYRQKNMVALVDSDKTPEESCMASINAYLKRTHEETKGRAFQLRLQNKKTAVVAGKTTACLRIVKHIITSKGLLDALKTKPEFAAGIMGHFKKELDHISGDLAELQNVLKEWSTENAQLRAANVVLMNRNKSAEEQLITVIHKHQNNPFAEATANHTIFANSTPINPFIGPNYRKHVNKAAQKAKKAGKSKNASGDSDKV